jgi:hypothetical protein
LRSPAGRRPSVVNSGSGRSDLSQAGAYVRHTAGNAYFTAALAYGWQFSDVTQYYAGKGAVRYTW